MQFWTIEEFTQFLQSSKHHVHYIAFSLAIYTGMRRGEILGLRWKDIDFEKKEPEGYSDSELDTGWLGDPAGQALSEYY